MSLFERAIVMAKGREILDSRGNPTVEAESGTAARAFRLL